MHFSARSGIVFQVDWVSLSLYFHIKLGLVCQGGLDGFNATTIATAHCLLAG